MSVIFNIAASKIFSKDQIWRLLFLATMLSVMLLVPQSARSEFILYDRTFDTESSEKYERQRPIEFSDLINSALSNHPSILSQKQSISDAKYIGIQGATAILPDIQFTRSRNANIDSKPYTLNDSQSINISMSTRGLTAYASVMKLAYLIKESRMSEEIGIKDNILVNLYESYFGLCNSRRNLEVAEEHLLLAQMNYEGNRKTVELDRGQAHELIASEANLLDAEAKVVDAQGSISRLIAEIEDATGMSLSEDDIERLTRDTSIASQVPTGDITRMCEQSNLYEAVATKNPKLNALSSYANSLWAEANAEFAKNLLPYAQTTFSSTSTWTVKDASSIFDSLSTPGSAKPSNSISASVIVPILPKGGSDIVSAARYRLRGRRERYNRNDALLQMLSQARMTCDRAKSQLLALDGKRRMVDSFDLILQEAMESNKDGKKSEADVVAARAAFLKSKAEYFELDAALKLSTMRILAIRGETNSMFKSASRPKQIMDSYSK